MKKLMMSLAMVAALAASAAAQAPQNAKNAPKSPEERAQRQTEMMTKQLTLTADEVTKVKAINLKYAGQMDDMRGKAQAEKGEKKDAMKDMRDQRNAELKTVLTPEQYDKMIKDQEAMRQQRMERMKEHKDGQ